ncbi:MAG: porin family protein [Ferruginibacter sp.]
MKPFFLVCSLLLFIYGTKAQTKLALKAGANYSTAKASFNGIKQPTSYVPGLNIGLQMTTAFEPPLFFTALAHYSMRGYIIKPTSGSISRYENRIHYIDLTPLLSFHVKTSSQSNLVLSAGPLAGLALSGTEKQTENGITTSKKMTLSTSGNYGLFDLAIYSSIGLHFDKFFVEAAYEHGFVNINNNVETDGKDIQNRIFSLNLGYYFH